MTLSVGNAVCAQAEVSETSAKGRHEGNQGKRTRLLAKLVERGPRRLLGLASDADRVASRRERLLLDEARLLLDALDLLVLLGLELLLLLLALLLVVGVVPALARALAKVARRLTGRGSAGEELVAELLLLGLVLAAAEPRAL